MARVRVPHPSRPRVQCWYWPCWGGGCAIPRYDAAFVVYDVNVPQVVETEPPGALKLGHVKYLLTGY